MTEENKRNQFSKVEKTQISKTINLRSVFLPRLSGVSEEQGEGEDVAAKRETDFYSC